MLLEEKPFGRSSKFSQEPAKDVIFPSYNEDSAKGEDLYIRSHGSYGAGQQRDRHYDWPVDPNQTRFGRKGDTIAFNGVSKNINDILKYTDENPSVLGVKKVCVHPPFGVYFHKLIIVCLPLLSGGRFP